MSYVVFLAPVQDFDSNVANPNTVFGMGTLFDHPDESWVRLRQSEGKVSLQGAEIRRPRVTPIAATTATVNWTVDQPCTSMKVYYGTTSGYGSQQAATPAAGVGDILANLTGLVTNTLYHYQIEVNVGAGLLRTRSPDYTFRTL